MEKKKRVLNVASGGGHWVQLLRVTKQLQEFVHVYVATSQSFQSDVPGDTFYSVPNFDRKNVRRVIGSLTQVAIIVFKERPDVVISTGAAPGVVALLFGKLFGARTIWIDSVANAEKLSLSGQLARPLADLWITQWKHLAKDGGPLFFGSVL